MDPGASDGALRFESVTEPTAEDQSGARPYDRQATSRHAIPDGDPVERLVHLFDLDRVDDDVFEEPNRDRGFGDRVFGGQVAACSLRAASNTVEVDHHVHSLHAYFLRPGKPGIPIRYHVDRHRDGRSFTTRAVVAKQGDEVIFNASLSYQTHEDGMEYQVPIADVPAPDEAPANLGFIPEEAREHIPMELVVLDRPPADDRGVYPSSRRVWMRIKRRLPDDPALHTAMIAFLSDMGAVEGAWAPVEELDITKVMGASLDHSLWFHRPMRADEWFLYDLQTVSNSNSRGLARGTMHSLDGTLGVSVSQEALLRRRR